MMGYEILMRSRQWAISGDLLNRVDVLPNSDRSLSRTLACLVTKRQLKIPAERVSLSCWVALAHHRLRSKGTAVV